MGGRGGGGWGRGAGGGGGPRGGGGGRKQNQNSQGRVHQNARETREDVKKFLTFYKRTK